MQLIIGKAMVAAVEAGEVSESVLEEILREYVIDKRERAFLGLDE